MERRQSSSLASTSSSQGLFGEVSPPCLDDLRTRSPQHQPIVIYEGASQYHIARMMWDFQPLPPKACCRVSHVEHETEIGRACGCWMQAPEPKGRQRVHQCASKHKYALAGCLALAALYLLWMAWASLSGKRGEPGWVHKRERGSGSIGTFRLRYATLLTRSM